MKTSTPMGMELSPERRRRQARRNRLNREATARPTSLTRVTIATLCPQDGCFNPMPCATHARQETT